MAIERVKIAGDGLGGIVGERAGSCGLAVGAGPLGLKAVAVKRAEEGVGVVEGHGPAGFVLDDGFFAGADIAGDAGKLHGGGL
ncbi:hypothetical protein DV096_13725 [Bradymonadaceae bacterium TMQ3]|nr:hypothetical protein DV096_13725 [Bradymonadaceae bacterium TMQ3]